VRLLALAAVVLLAACQAPITPKAVPAPQSIDCDLIFPAPSKDTLAP
jgi:uncharacterized lipoprotein YajG